MDDSGRHQVENQAERVWELLEEAAAAAGRRPRNPIPEIASSWDRLPVGVLVVLLVAMCSVVALT